MEFYCVVLENGDRAYFKDKQKAFDYLWNEYLNNLDSDTTEEEIKFRREELYEAYYISGCGDIEVLGFADE